MTTGRRPTNDQPTDLSPQGQFAHFAKISNGHNTATRQPIACTFGFRVGFSGTADRTAPFPVGLNPRWRPAAILENFKWPILWNALSDSLYVCTQTILCRRTPIYNEGDSKRYKETERKGRSWEIVQKISREEYTFDWWQSKAFLVSSKIWSRCFSADRTRSLIRQCRCRRVFLVRLSY